MFVFHYSKEEFLKIVKQTIFYVDPSDETFIEYGEISKKFGANDALAEILEDYIGAAFGRVFLKERNIIPAKEYQRWLNNDELSEPIRYQDDVLWKPLENLAKSLAENPDTRPIFSRIARDSAEVDALNQAMNNGETWQSLEGAHFGNATIGILKFSNWPR